jgi:hypothetical protein
MKTLRNFLLLCILLVSPSLSRAQEKITVINENIDMSRGNNPAYVVVIPQSEASEIQKNWAKRIKQNTNARVIQKGVEYSITGTRVVEIYYDPINVYNAVVQVDSSVKLVTLFEIDGMFFSPRDEDEKFNNKKTHQDITKFVYNFAIEEYRKSISKQIEEGRKRLQEYGAQLSKLEKENTTFNTNLKTNENNLKLSETKFSSLEKERERIVAEVSNNQNNLNSAPNKKDAQKLLKKSEKEMKTVGNNLIKEQDKIKNYKTKIVEFKSKIKENLETQERTKWEIERQKKRVNELFDTLGNIK